MGVLAEAVIAAFDANAQITWTTQGPRTAVASFLFSGETVRTTFTETSTGEWRAAFEVTPGQRTATDAAGLSLSLRILGGVFQSVREFLEVRQPSRLVFASKTESLGDLYETYLARQDNALARQGYEAHSPIRSSPLTEFTIVKRTASAWRPA